VNGGKHHFLQGRKTQNPETGGFCVCITVKGGKQKAMAQNNVTMRKLTIKKPFAKEIKGHFCRGIALRQRN